MIRLRGHFRPGVTTLVVVFLALAGIAAFWADPAPAVTGTTGPATVTVTGNGSAANGQVAHIHAAATTGDLFEIRAHLCAGGATIKNTFNFSFDGAYCTPSALAAGSDFETVQKIDPGTGGKGDLEFRIGEGTGKPWTDYWGTSHTLTCGPQNPCELVLQLQVTDNTVFYAVPVCYGTPCPTGGDPSPTTAAPAAAGTTPPPSTAGSPAAAGTGAQATSAPKGARTKGSASGVASGAASPPATTSVTAAAATTAGTVDGQALSSSDGVDHGSSPRGSGLATSVFGDVSTHQAIRVFAAGLAGLIGGILLALIATNARKQMMGLHS